VQGEWLNLERLAKLHLSQHAVKGLIRVSFSSELAPYFSEFPECLAHFWPPCAFGQGHALRCLNTTLMWITGHVNLG
jgi:hypothetical protein